MDISEIIIICGAIIGSILIIMLGLIQIKLLGLNRLAKKLNCSKEVKQMKKKIKSG